MSEEKLKILKMIETGIITADEGYKLMEAIGESDEEKNEKSDNAKWVRIRVLGNHGDKNVNVKLPVNVFKVGMKLGSKFSIKTEGVNAEAYYEALKSAIENDLMGEVVNVQTDSGDTVIITIE